MSSKEFVELLDKMKLVHNRKSSDYAAINSPFENFDRSSWLASWFKNDIDKTFAVLIGVKLARLATLLGKVSKPNNESIADTFLDLANYCTLWAAYHAQKDSGATQVETEKL